MDVIKQSNTTIFWGEKMVSIIRETNGDHFCKDCGGINWCHCDENQSEPICECGRLGYECICDELDDKDIGENDEL